MRRLSRQQLVELDLESADRAMQCRVESILGAVATLRPASQPTEPLGSNAAGYLLFEHQGRLVALRGLAVSAATPEPKLEFVVTDHVQLPERRTAERVPIAARADITPLNGGRGDAAAIETITANISVSGALVARRDGLSGASSFRIELHVGREATPIVCEAQLARTTPSHLGLRFAEISEADRIRLGGIIFRHQRLGG